MRRRVAGDIVDMLEDPREAGNKLITFAAPPVASDIETHGSHPVLSRSGPAEAGKPSTSGTPEQAGSGSGVQLA